MFCIVFTQVVASAVDCASSERSINSAKVDCVPYSHVNLSVMQTSSTTVSLNWSCVTSHPVKSFAVLWAEVNMRKM